MEISIERQTERGTDSQFTACLSIGYIITKIQADRKTHRHINRQKRWTDRKMKDWQMKLQIQTVRQTDRKTDRQTDRQTKRQTDKKTDRQTDR